MNNTYYQRPNNSGKCNNSSNRHQVYESHYEQKSMGTEEQERQYYQPNYQAQQYEAYRRPVVRQQSIAKELITNIILVVLSISLVIALFTLGAELNDIDRYYEKDANSFWWAYESGRYVDSIKDGYENKYNRVIETSELSQCYAVSEYFEAASLYKAAVVTGKTDKVQEYLTVMEESLDKMGDVDYLAEEINVKLGIGELEE